MLQEGIDTWQLAGAVLVKLREKDRSVFSEIIRRAPTLTVDMLLTLERVGSRQLHPKLLMNAAMPAKRLIGFPYDEQDRLCSVPIDVVVCVKNGEPVVMKKMVKDMSRLELQRALGESRLRTIPEQIEAMHTNEGNAAWQAMSRKRNPVAAASGPVAAQSTVATRAVPGLPVAFLGRWVVRKTIGNNVEFERTNSKTDNVVRVILDGDGVAVVEVCKRLS